MSSLGCEGGAVKRARKGAGTVVKPDRPNHSQAKTAESPVWFSCHYSYECKAQAQERPYISRPSRSQQLLNPKLKPKLANIAPTPTLTEQEYARPRLDTTSSAVHKPIQERPRKRSLDDMDDHRSSRKRSRSAASFSSGSVSTISTRSPSPERPRYRHDTKQEREASATGGAGDKRVRPSSSTSSPDHMQSYEAHSRNTRMRRNSRSPSERGRRRGRSANSERRMRSVAERNTLKDARGLTPNRRTDDADDNAMLGQHTGLERADYKTYRDQDREMKDVPSGERPRSLSPFSKRLALTKSLNR
ncbi:unnamed protein product [Aureobasidium mustum]|uniref:Uncharacterized protein n=1 Tax=Aureobasidium mustum TaxID=2773714 RepID=A0A9N8JIE4_9PEZI|nr:unnamed protein product [Aureobasidium mustum]